MDLARLKPLRSVLAPLRGWPPLGAETLRGDLVAGLTGAVIVLPQGVAFATIAGLPPQYGLYSAMVPAIVAALFGSSWHLVSGPTTAISIVVFGVLSPLAEPGTPSYVSLALTLTFMVGAVQLAMGLARLGGLVNFISHTVVIGFTAGAGLLIASNQLKNFLGIDVPRGASFFRTLAVVVRHAGDANPYVTAVGVATLAAGVVFRRVFPRFPYMIAAILAGSLAGVVLDAGFGASVTGIRTVGALPGTLPPLSHPTLTMDSLEKLAGSAVALALLALTEAVSIARAIGVRSEQRIDGNREFVGQGLSNLVGSFFSSYASSGSFNRTGLNYEAGARTPLAAAFASVSLALVVLLVAPLAAYLPVAAMAGVLFLVAWGLVDVRHVRAIVRASRAETAILAATFLATLTLDLEIAIYVGVLLSLAVYLKRTSSPPVRALVPDRGDPGRRLARTAGTECAQLKIVEVSGSLFFGAVDHVRQRLEEIGTNGSRQRHVLLVAHGINFADIGGAEMLAAEARRRRRLGGGLYLLGATPATLEALRAGGYLRDIGEENVFESMGGAVVAIRRRLDPAICTCCERRVFRECSPGEAPARRRAPELGVAMAAAAFAEEGDPATARRLVADAEAADDDEPEPRERALEPDDEPETPPVRRTGAS